MYSVTIWTDDLEFYLERNAIMYWVMLNSPSYIKHEFIDMSDVDSWVGKSDSGYEFFFSDEQDATLFSLRWS